MHPCTDSAGCQFIGKNLLNKLKFRTNQICLFFHMCLDAINILKKLHMTQQYLPDGLTGEVFYEPSENGYEQQIRAYYKKIKENPEE